MKKIIIILFLMTSFSYADECNIIFGVSKTPYKPYSWVDKDGNTQGLNIELFKALANEAECSYEIRPMLWTNLLTGFNDGTIDVMVSSLSPFANSRKGDNILQIPFNIAFYGYFYSRTDSPLIKGIEDLREKTVLVLDGSVTHDYLNNLKNEYDISVVAYPSTESAIQALAEGIGHAGMFSMTAAINAIELGGYTNIRVSGRPIFPAPYGFLVHSGSENYDILNNAMETLKSNGKYFDIMKKWQKSDNSLYVWLTRAAIGIVIGAFIFLGVMLWNKMLYEQVQKKTMALNQEIEQRKLTEQENIKLRDEAMIAGKLALLGEMAGSIVHEINNPVGLIIHNTEFIIKYHKELGNFLLEKNQDIMDTKLCGMGFTEAINEADEALLENEESLARIADVIRELKEYGKAQDDSVLIIDVGECINVAVRLTHYFIKRYTDNFTVDIGEHQLKIRGNMLHIEQMIINIIYNSCYALTSKAQKIWCSLSCEVFKEKDYAKIIIADEGVGIEQEVKEKLFTPFFTTRKDLDGTGLGLAIVSRILKEHDGFLEVESEVGYGTKISIYLPIHKDEQP